MGSDRCTNLRTRHPYRFSSSLHRRPLLLLVAALGQLRSRQPRAVFAALCPTGPAMGWACSPPAVRVKCRRKPGSRSWIILHNASIWTAKKALDVLLHERKPSARRMRRNMQRDQAWICRDSEMTNHLGASNGVPHYIVGGALAKIALPVSAQFLVRSRRSGIAPCSQHQAICYSSIPFYSISWKLSISLCTSQGCCKVGSVVTLSAAKTLTQHAETLHFVQDDTDSRVRTSFARLSRYFATALRFLSGYTPKLHRTGPLLALSLYIHGLRSCYNRRLEKRHKHPLQIGGVSAAKSYGW